MKSWRSILSKVLICAGLAIVTVSVVYEAANYPWNAVFFPNSAQTDSLPDPTAPADLPEDVEIVKYTDQAEDIAAQDEPDAPQMPGEDTISAPVSPKSTNAPVKAKPKKQFVLLGVFKLPKLNISVNLFEGSGEQMRSGVGHVTGTVLPGQEGNAVFSGHRSYIRMHPFRHLDLLKSGDKAIIHFNGHVFTYTAFETFFVGPDETWVMRAINGEKYAATLITCDPVIRPTRRMIVRMRLTEVDSMTPEEYFKQLEAPAKPVIPAPATPVQPESTPPEETAAAPDGQAEDIEQDSSESPVQSAQQSVSPDTTGQTAPPDETASPDSTSPPDSPQPEKPQ